MEATLANFIKYLSKLHCFLPEEPYTSDTLIHSFNNNYRNCRKGTRQQWKLTRVDEPVKNMVPGIEYFDSFPGFLKAGLRSP